MSLDARTRSSLYEKLRPILGDDDANALMSEFPSTEGDELVTKQFLRAELLATRNDLRDEIAGLRAEMHDEMRQIVVWNTGTILTGMALAFTIAKFAG